MLRRTATTFIVGIPYSTIIVGGGNAGCYLAHKLCMAGQRVALVEEGADIRTKPRWHYEIPSSLIAHRINKSGYEATVTTTPQLGYKGASIGAVSIPYPKVLGGSGVMGSRAWVHGDVSDWEGTPFNFKKDIRPALQEIEGIENPLPHRGKYGKFFVSRPSTISPTYRPFSEALIEKKQAYIIDFMNETGIVQTGIGRPEVLIDKRNCQGHSTLRSYLLEATNLRRDVTVYTGVKATELLGKGGKIHGISAIDKDGKPITIEARRVVLAANAVNSAQLILRSKDFAEQVASLPAIGQNFFDKPRVVLQYKALHADTHQMFDSPVTRFLAFAEWQAKGRGNAVTSSYDDMALFWGPGGQAGKPAVKVTLQPFAMNNLGAFSQEADHALQFTLELLQPTSRGLVTATDVNPNYYTTEADKATMAEAVAFVKSLSSTKALQGYLAGAEPFAEFEEGSGLSGGSLALGSVVDPENFSVKGFEGLHAADASVLPHPMIGCSIATTLATSTLLSRSLTDGASKLAAAQKLEIEKANSHPGKVGGQDDSSERVHSSKVKVTYY